MSNNVQKQPKRKRAPDRSFSRAAIKNPDIIFAAFDTETLGLGGELLMIQWGIFDEVKHSSGPEKIRDFLSDVFKFPDPVVWYCHNAQYDFRYFMDYFVEHEIPVKLLMRTDNDIYEIRILSPSGKWCILRDSFAFWNSSLADLGKTFCPEIPKLEIDIENFNPSNPEHIEYARRDVEILLKALPILDQKIRANFGVSIGPTTAGTALRAWQNTLAESEVHYCSSLDSRELFIRQAYYGGVVFLTTNKTLTDCQTFDINSSYPYVMDKLGVPGGAVCETEEIDFSLPGIYHCLFETPKRLQIPIIPSRDVRGFMQWRSGIFESVVTGYEIEFALKQGYKLLRVFSGLKWEKIIYPFSDFVAKCKAIRKENKGKPEEKLAKLMQNSLYGKFGSRRERRVIIAAHCAKDDELIGALPYDEKGKWYVKKEISETQKCKPEWAVFITARARLNLLNVAYCVGPENCFYGDTDSLTIDKNFSHLVPQGAEYGQFKLEKDWQFFRPIAPKVYAGILRNGEYCGAAKGLLSKNITDENWHQLLTDGESTAQALSLDSLRSSLKKGVTPASLLLRHSSKLENSKNYQIEGEDVIIRAA